MTNSEMLEVIGSGNRSQNGGLTLVKTQQSPDLLNKFGFPVNAIAMRFRDLIGGRQLEIIRRLARDLRIDANAECFSLMMCSVDELSKTAASFFIDYLERQAHSQMRKAS